MEKGKPSFAAESRSSNQRSAYRDLVDIARLSMPLMPKSSLQSVKCVPSPHMPKLARSRWGRRVQSSHQRKHKNIREIPLGLPCIFPSIQMLATLSIHHHIRYIKHAVDNAVANPHPAINSDHDPHSLRARIECTIDNLLPPTK